MIRISSYFTTAKADSTSRFILPRIVILSVLGICVLPLCLNLVGVDFSIAKPDLGNVVFNLVAESAPNHQLDMMHHTLLGSFTHTILEWSAVCTATFIAILSFVHFSLNRNAIVPIIGIALFYAGCMDAFHTLAADRMIGPIDNTDNFVPFTWAICRLFNALIGIVGIGSFLILSPQKRTWGIGFVTATSAILGMIAYGIIHICATSSYVPQTQFPNSLITRPWDVIPLVLYAIAGLVIYPKFYRKYPSLFAATLILSTVPAVVTQAYMAFNSSMLFDNGFNVAHFLKVISYIVPLVGLSLDYIQTYQEKQNALSLLQDSELHLKEAITDLQNTQSQLVQSEKMSSLGQLVAGIAHEINNPVNFIYGNINHAHTYSKDLLYLVDLYQKHYPEPIEEVKVAIEEVELDFIHEDLPKLLTSIRVGAERIQKIVLSLRNFSRMDQADLKPVDIHEGIDSTLMILQNRLKATSEMTAIQVIKEYGDLPEIECYAGQLNQVFMNILINAIDALDENGLRNTQAEEAPWIKIFTQLKKSEQSKSDTVIIRFMNNGPEIPAEVKAKIFDPFFTTKPVGKGTGMGMSISYQIITERHGGKLECISTPVSTEFMIEIPLQQTNLGNKSI